MAKVSLAILEAWRHSNEESRIHYRVMDQSTGRSRRLYTDAGSALYAMLAPQVDKEPAKV